MFTYNSIKHSKSVYLVRVCLNDSLLKIGESYSLVGLSKCVYTITYHYYRF